jgi:hypothetical protein
MNSMKQMAESTVTISDSTNTAPATAIVPITTSHSAGPCQQSEEPANNDNSDARQCVVCITDVDVKDVCWIELKCEPHSHFYHNDCLLHWWFEKNRYSCPRCTQAVKQFTIHARPVTGDTVTRTFSTTPPDVEVADQELVLVAQSASTLAPEAINERMSAYAALLGWLVRLWTGKPTDLTIEGNERIRELTGAFDAMTKRLDSVLRYYAEGRFIVEATEEEGEEGIDEMLLRAHEEGRERGAWVEMQAELGAEDGRPHEIASWW